MVCRLAGIQGLEIETLFYFFHISFFLLFRINDSPILKPSLEFLLLTNCF
jgi:hypothetical protein